MAMFDPAYPGEIIAEILEDQGVSLRQFAVAMDLLPSKKTGDQPVFLFSADTLPTKTILLKCLLRPLSYWWICRLFDILPAIKGRALQRTC